MPKRRRNRKNKRTNYKKTQNVGSKQCDNSKQEIKEVPKPEQPEFLNRVLNITPVKLSSNADAILPMRLFCDGDQNISQQKSSFGSVTLPRDSRGYSDSLICTTPVSTGNMKNSTTNLGTLIDNKLLVKNMERLNNVTPNRSRDARDDICGDILLNNHRINSSRSKIRSNSSMSKLNTPGADRIPIMISVATQTVYFNNSIEKRNSSSSDRSSIYLENYINIFETPKISQLEKLEQAFELESSLTKDLKHNHTNINVKEKGRALNISKKINHETLRHLQSFNDILSNAAYVSPKVIQNDLRNNNESDVDMSFFSPPLKTVSTPIEKVQNNEKLIESLAKNILTKNEKMGSYIYNTTPNEKNIKNHIGDKVYTQKIYKCNNYVNKRRIYHSVSPKKSRDISSKFSSRNEKLSTPIGTESLKRDCTMVPKTFTPAKSMCSTSESFLNVSSTNRFARFMTNAKKIHRRYSAKWMARLLEACNWLGINVKKKISSLCSSVQNPEDTIISSAVPQQDVCRNCTEYQQQIITLSTRLDVLGTELHSNKNEVKMLSEEMAKMKQDFTELADLKKKMNEIEEHLKTRPHSVAPPCGRSSQPPTPPPPPPPPLPPPLPTPMEPHLPNKNSRVSSKKSGNKKDNENSRPVITLDDILNVKLKKPSDKPHGAATLRRKTTIPLISTEMLSQIKLRPTFSRPHTPSSLKDVSSGSSLVSTVPSPTPSLTKILSNVDTNVRRVKRLRRYSGYSLDDSRKHLLRRERGEPEAS